MFTTTLQIVMLILMVASVCSNLERGASLQSAWLQYSGYYPPYYDSFITPQTLSVSTDKVQDYLANGTYPEGETKAVKGVISKRAKKFQLVDGV